MQLNQTPLSFKQRKRRLDFRPFVFAVRHLSTDSRLDRTLNLLDCISKSKIQGNCDHKRFEIGPKWDHLLRSPPCQISSTDRVHCRHVDMSKQDSTDVNNKINNGSIPVIVPLSHIRQWTRCPGTGSPECNAAVINVIKGHHGQVVETVIRRPLVGSPAPTEQDTEPRIAPDAVPSVDEGFYKVSDATSVCECVNEATL